MARHSRLVEILADMLRCALAWEEEQGCKRASPVHESCESLTSIPLGIHCPPRSGGSKTKIRARDDGEEGHDR